MKILELENTNLSDAQFVDFLYIIGDLLPRPLRSRMDVDEYAKKLKMNAEIFVAFDNDGDLAGLMCLYANNMSSKEAYLPFIGIIPSFQGKGLGRTMMQRAIAIARQKHMQSINLEVGPDNLKAQNLYEKLGFMFTNKTGNSWHMKLEIPKIFDFGTSSFITPLQKINKVESLLGLDIDLRIKRDDLFGMPGGGNKARKIQYILRHAIEQGYTALVTNGGPQSNHARATAIVAAQYGLHCHLAIPLKQNKNYLNTGNILLMRMAGATIEFCELSQLAQKMDSAMEVLGSQGHKPLYIWGGGHCVQGTEPFVDAVDEFRTQANGWEPDYMVFASGTGTTHAGFSIGFANSNTKVVGISVARDSQRGASIVQQSIGEYQEYKNMPQRSIPVHFRDEWTCGGYELYNEHLLKIISMAARAGLFVDPTYSGKAFTGLVDMVKSKEIPPGSKVLFWHTGGLLNIMACQEFVNSDPFLKPIT